MVFLYEPYMRKILFSLRYANKIGDVKIELMSSGFGLWRKVYQQDSVENIDDLGSLHGRFNQNESNMRRLFQKDVIESFYPCILNMKKNIPDEERDFTLKLIDLVIGFCAVLLEINRVEDSIETLEYFTKLIRVDKICKRMNICLRLMTTSMKIQKYKND